MEIKRILCLGIDKNKVLPKIEEHRQKDFFFIQTFEEFQKLNQNIEYFDALLIGNVDRAERKQLTDLISNRVGKKRHEVSKKRCKPDPIEIREMATEEILDQFLKRLITTPKQGDEKKLQAFLIEELDKARIGRSDKKDPQVIQKLFELCKEKFPDMEINIGTVRAASGRHTKLWNAQNAS